MSEVTRFYIADLQIDLSRSLVIKGGEPVQVEPKVLKVLLLLAQRQNEVVTHKEIMETVWQGTEVVPNALQRCIAILRKELGDDAKTQRVIATHPRIGYSLVAPVHWPSSESSASDATAKSEGLSGERRLTEFPRKRLLAFVSLLILVTVWLVNQWWLKPDLNQYIQVEKLTQSDAHEAHAVYSPNGDYVIFSRYAGSCLSHLWAKHLETGTEMQLSKQAANFSALSFTQGGRELVFAANGLCEKSREINDFTSSKDMCWSIATLDLAESLVAPQLARHRYMCGADKLMSPKSLGHHRYAFLQRQEKRHQLMQYDDLTKQLVVLYALEQEYIFAFDYNAKTKNFAVLSRTENAQTVIDVVDLSGQRQSRFIVQLPSEVSASGFKSIAFEAAGESLLATIAGRVYRIELSGEVQLLPLPQSNIVSAVKHPSSDDLLAIQGMKDTDVVQVALDQQAQTPTSHNTSLNPISLPYPSLARSNAQERDAKFQPNGEKMAFISNRSGKDQIWLWENGEVRQLTTVSQLNHINSFVWSPGGSQIAWGQGNTLMVSSIEGKEYRYQSPLPLHSVLTWDEPDRLLVLVNDPVPSGLYQYDIKQQTLTPFGINFVKSAWIRQQTLFYSNLDGAVFRRALTTAEGKDQELPQLNGHAMLMDKDFIYAVEKDSLQLNQYDLNGKWIKTLTTLKPNAWKITGVAGNQLLLTQFVAINHDIVELKAK